MSRAQKFQDMIGGYHVMYRRVYNKKDLVVIAMLGAGLEEYITNGFTMEEIADKRRNLPIVHPPYGTGSASLVETNAKQIRVPLRYSGPSDARSSQLEQILKELYQMERDMQMNWAS